MQPLLALAALLLGAPYVRGQATCADKAAAKVLNSSNLPEPCVVPYTFSSSANVSGYPLPTAWLGPAPICYTQYYQNQLATPTFMPRNSTCSAYAHRGCCSSETVKSIDDQTYGSTGLYPGYGSRCGPLSAQCTAFFQMEACFYECDHNIGRYRAYPSCLANVTGEQNGWQIANMPLSSTMVNAWYSACANDLFCTGSTGSYFDLPTTVCKVGTSTCRKFSDIYGVAGGTLAQNATSMITKLWDGSFSYGGPNDFVFPNASAAPFDGVLVTNPNNVINTNIADPPFCSFRTAVSGWQQATSDFLLYISNMQAYAGATFAGALYTANTTINGTWFVAPATAAPAPAAPACSAAPTVRVVAAVAVTAAVAALF